MSSRQTWFWVILTVVLLAAIMVSRRNHPRPGTGPAVLLPDLRPDQVTSIVFRPPGESRLEIRMDRSVSGWQLTAPLQYPAQVSTIERLLSDLARLTPATFISPAETDNQGEAENRYGFTSIQSSAIIIQQGEYRIHLVLGIKTAPGDQVFLQVVGRPGAYVVDSAILNSLPVSANNWRDTSLINLNAFAFDRITVTNGPRVLELQRGPEQSIWQIVRPFPTRGNHARIEESLNRLQALQVQEFVSDSAETDLESFGLQPPSLAVCFHSGTNTAALLLFGKNPTNDLEKVYACRMGDKAIVTVPTDILTPWRAPVTDFRDPYLLRVTQLVHTLEVQAGEKFLVERTRTNSWRILPQDMPGDSDSIANIITLLDSLQITQYVKDAVTEADLPAYGLLPPSSRYQLRSGPIATNVAESASNTIATLEFGVATNFADRVYARRIDESCVYAVSTSDFSQLPSHSWQLRDRKLWHFSIGDVAGATIRQQDRQRQITRKGVHDWALAPGSSGVINDLAVEETVRAICEVKAGFWVAYGEQHRERFGLAKPHHQITLLLQNGQSAAIDFGLESPSGGPFAGTTLDGNYWIFEFPWLLYRDAASHLSVPP